MFANLEQTTVSAQIRLNWSFTPNLSLQTFVQPLVSAGRYTDFKAATNTLAPTITATATEAAPEAPQARPSAQVLPVFAPPPGIGRRAHQMLESRGLPLPAEGVSAEEVFKASRRGEAWARQVVGETVDYLSFAIAAVTAILDPEVIVLGGGVARSADVLIGPILEKLDGVMPGRPNLVQSSLGSRAAAMGAIMLVLDITTEHVALMHYA